MGVYPSVVLRNLSQLPRVLNYRCCSDCCQGLYLCCYRPSIIAMEQTCDTGYVNGKTLTPRSSIDHKSYHPYRNRTFLGGRHLIPSIEQRSFNRLLQPCHRRNRLGHPVPNPGQATQPSLCPPEHMFVYVTLYGTTIPRAHMAQTQHNQTKRSSHSRIHIPN